MNALEQAFIAAAEQTAEPVGPPITARVPDHARIRVQDGDGHMLDGAVISWSIPAGRDE